MRGPTNAHDQSSNIAALLWRAAEERPHAEAIVDGGRRVTFRALRDRAAAIAESLRREGVAPGERVAVLLERSADAAAAVYGILASGAAGICVNDRLRPRQIEHVLRHSGATVLLTSDEMLSRHPRPLETEATIVLLGSIPAVPDAPLAPAPRDATDAAQIIYTSGSTGLPKGVVFTHGSIDAAVRIVSSYLGLRAADRVASLLAFSSVYGLNQLLCATRCGASLVIETSPLPDAIIGTLRSEAVTVVAAVPPLWTQLLTVPGFRQPMAALRLLQNAGGHLPAPVTRQLRQLQPHGRLFLQYGMTETFRSTFLPPEEVDRRPDCMGRAMPCTDIFVVREDLTICAPGEVGELVHRGPTVAAGYWNDPAATDLVFRRDPFAAPGEANPARVVFSGDLVRRDPEGFLYYVSRRDRLIKTLGFRVGPDEIADVLFASGEINECVVTSEPDAQRGNRIVAFVVLVPGGSLDRLNRYSRMELPRYMQPARMQAVDALPRLASGKYDVAALHQATAVA